MDSDSKRKCLQLNGAKIGLWCTHSGRIYLDGCMPFCGVSLWHTCNMHDFVVKRQKQSVLYILENSVCQQFTSHYFPFYVCRQTSHKVTGNYFGTVHICIQLIFIHNWKATYSWRQHDSKWVLWNSFSHVRVLEQYIVTAHPRRLPSIVSWEIVV